MENNFWNYDNTKLIFDNLDIGIHIIDRDGVTILYNEACKNMDGTHGVKVLGRNLQELVNEGIFSRAIGLEALRKEEMASNSQTVNGRLIFTTSNPIYDSNDEILCVLTSCMDISKVERTQNELDYLKKENEYLVQELANQTLMRENEEKIVLKSKEMQELKNKANRVAAVESTVLILGETGVGKGVISKYIHNNSNLKDGPFIKINCGSLPENLIESELFGYEEGAFTDAIRGGKKGLIELANGGTLFLDEVGELPLNVQVKLLNVLQEKTIQRIGSTKEMEVNVRIIAATNKNLKEAVEKGTFREDLYYRLNVIPIEIPPLRERKDDILPLTKLFLDKVNKEYNLKREMSPSAMKLLLTYDWPGNVRELENIIERAAVTSEGMVIGRQGIEEILQIENPYTRFTKKLSYKEDVLAFEKALLQEYSREVKNFNEMSKLTGLDPSTIRKKVKRLNIKLDFQE